MTEANFWHIDAFTSVPFKGNPAGVCWLSAPRSQQWLQDFAADLNLPETAFIIAQDGLLNLRWFTPQVEVPLCGHATLASAYALWSSGRVSLIEPIHFETLSGRLTCRRDEQWIEMDFPAEPATPSEISNAILDAVGIQSSPLAVYKNRLAYFVELNTPPEIQALVPQFGDLQRLGNPNIVVTAASPKNAEHDFISRFFAPGLGIPEDPVTGAAHCALGPYWMAKTGKSQLVGYQASSRGGTVRMRLERDRVFLSGQAVTIFEGTLK